jgi:hypothetical protein
MFFSTLHSTQFQLRFLGILPVFLGAFAKLRGATNTFVMSVYPSVSMEQLGSHWPDFHETFDI